MKKSTIIIIVSLFFGLTFTQCGIHKKDRCPEVGAKSISVRH